MPRSNRPRRRPTGNGAAGDVNGDGEDLGLSRTLFGRSRAESGRDGSWNVQSLAAASATKSYTCPGCRLTIEPGVAHTVAWRADGLMGAADDIAARRHWHHHCWKIRQ
jgi:hypothetical protein